MAARAMRLIRAVKATRAIRVTGATRYAREGGHECRSDCTDACFRVKKIPGKQMNSNHQQLKNNIELSFFQYYKH